MLSYCLVNKINNKKPSYAGRYCFTFWYDWCYSYTFVLDSYVETTKHWVPGTGHGHRFVITVHGYASETNVLIIYSLQPVGVWLLRSFPKKEYHLWEMFVLSHVASSLPIYMFWFFFLFFSLWFPSGSASHQQPLTFPFFKAYFRNMAGPASSQSKDNDKLLARGNST